MTKTDYKDISVRAMAARLKRSMRAGKTLAAACEERGWSYMAVYQRLTRAGLLDEVMAAKYQTTEAGQ